MVSKYMALPEEKRAGLRQKAKDRYHGPNGDRQRAVQYLKCLQCSLIKNCRAATLERHGIEVIDGEYRFKATSSSGNLVQGS